MAWHLRGGGEAGGDEVTAWRPGPVRGPKYPDDDLGLILISHRNSEIGPEGCKAGGGGVSGVPKHL